MKKLTLLTLAIACVFVVGCSPEGGRPYSGQAGQGSPSADRSESPTETGRWVFRSETEADPRMFVEAVDNPYWPLEPGSRWSYEAETDEGTETIDVVVKDDSKDVMGIPCTVVQDTVRVGGELVEDTSDWYAQDVYGNVWYMGEDSKEYENGEVASTAGSWEAGVDGARPGIKMWAAPRIGGPPYYQEYYRGEAEDLAMDLSTTGTADTPLDTYEDLLVIEEWNPLEPGVVERKYYRKGIGTVKEEAVEGDDEVVLLTEFELP